MTDLDAMQVEDMTPEEEAMYFAIVAQRTLRGVRKEIDGWKELETTEGLSEKDRAIATRARKQYEKQLPMHERNARNTADEFLRLTGRPFVYDEQEGR